ncbi:hypothetical protein WR25_07572 [Diploscapter pachys]|uniref:Uncharacterized protein n=1 Tax=Diploscapter pachys TaxID=2018661 RepID=A0A2A2LQ16_9BILA|nr:hypothetical protein WR25_07572 [Diploscapter pachys]
MMTIEPRAARCCCCNARITLIVLLCFYIFVGAIGAIYWIAGTSDHVYQKSYTCLLFSRVWRFVELALYILFLYGTVKRQPRILMAGLIYEIIGAVLTGIWYLRVIIRSSGQRSSMSSQQQQQMEETKLIDSFIFEFTAIIMSATLIVQSMICYLYFIVYRKAKSFQDSQLMVRSAGVVMQQGNYPNYPPYDPRRLMSQNDPNWAHMGPW